MRAEIETAIIALILSAGSVTSASNINPRGNPLGIYYDPAPSPEEGPPLSAGALRDPTYLPAEIGGIVGAYVFVLGIFGIALLLIGRRRRKLAARIREKLDVELVQPSFTVIQTYPSPLSPGGTTRNFSWPSPEKDGPNPYVFPATIRSPISPVGSDPNVDHRVVEKDKDYLQQNLEDLYARVMEQEEAKAAGIVLTDKPAPLPLLSPGPVPQTSPQRNTLSKTRNKPTNLDVSSEKSHSRTSSIISNLMSPKRKGIRGMRISSPIPTPLQATFPANYGSDEEPLSPRYTSPPPPPPVPTAENPYPYQHSRNNSTDPSPISPARSIAEQLTPYNVPQHRYTQSQTSIQSARNPLSSNPAPNSTSPRPVPNSTSPRPIQLSARPSQLSIATNSNPPSNPPSNNNSTRALPFRAFDPPPGLASPSFAQITKTTVLERAAPLSPGLRTPWTAGAVPYSPYQPFTPLMPMSPRLVTKEDRKAEKKKMKRMPVLEMVGSDDEMWDGAY
jgi:hypothetical protein